MITLFWVVVGHRSHHYPKLSWILLKILKLAESSAVESNCLWFYLCSMCLGCFGHLFPVRQFTTCSKSRFFLQISTRLCDDETEVWTEVNGLIKHWVNCSQCLGPPCAFRNAFPASNWRKKDWFCIWSEHLIINSKLEINKKRGDQLPRSK